MPIARSFTQLRPKKATGWSPSPRAGVVYRAGDMDESNIRNTGSFGYDLTRVGIKSTQQIKLDWSLFENHTFFNSAQAKTNVAFDKIINSYPFDGTRKELEAFFDDLTGFEKWVYDSFPKNKGYLNFINSWIAVDDRAGTVLPSLSNMDTGETILDPKNKSFTIELQLFVPTVTNDVQVICQKHSGSINHGISLILSDSADTTQALLMFAAVSGSMHLTSSAIISKGQFNHIVATLDRDSELHRTYLYVDEKLRDKSTANTRLREMDFSRSQLTIGSGSAFVANGTTFTPAATLSGSIDEFRIFHAVRSINEQSLFAKKNILHDDTLKLYYKFNEPTGTLGASSTAEINKIVLDSSKNSMHSKIAGTFSFILRHTSSLPDPMTHEKIEFSPILFPAHTKVANLNTKLLSSASLYDDANPNLITKLVPPHYFTEGQADEGLNSVDGTIISSYSGSEIPGSGHLGTAQLLSMLLFVYAKFFDELKIVLDSISTITFTDYDENNNVPAAFLPFLAEFYGLNIPNFFSDATIEQFVDAENITREVSTGELSLYSVQAQLMRRVLANIHSLVASKGTITGIKSLIRTLGIDPDNSLRIREYGGPTRRALGTERESRAYIAGMLNMSASACIVTSSYLSGSRTEVGYPDIAGTYVHHDAFPLHGISSNPNDGLFTSGSWTCEATYRYGKQTLSDVTQSLMRLATTGSNATPGVWANLVAISSSAPEIHLFMRSGNSTAAPMLQMSLSGANVFDGNAWAIAFGRDRNDSISSYASSSYFMMLSRYDDVLNSQKIFASASLFQESHPNQYANVMQVVSASTNASGTFLMIGSQSIDTSNDVFLNDSAVITDDRARAVTFDGKISNIKFWSRGFSIREWQEHSINRQSFGTINPLLNYSFKTQLTGAFERLRMDVNIEQEITSSNSDGTVQLFDFSQNNMTFDGSGFAASTNVIEKELARTSYLSPYFDEAVISNRVRIRGLYENDYNEHPYARHTPVSYIEPSEEVFDDTRLAIDFSIIDALNRDIMNMFSTLDAFDDALGAPESLFASDYRNIHEMREIYFNRLTGKIALGEFFELFKWFDTLLNGIIENFIPRKTRYFGTNFVIEPHVLERPKMQYSYTDSYLPQAQRMLSANIMTAEEMSGGDI